MTRHTILSLLRHLALAIVVLGALASASVAQLTEEQNAFYEQWLQDAERAENAIEAERASTAALEELRRDLVAYRQAFIAARDRNSARIRTIQSQIEALGPPPEEGRTEAEEVAMLREHLNTELNQFRVPAVVSQEAYNRADGMISEIDRIIRERQAEALFERGPMPLNPATWDDTINEIVDLLERLAGETVSEANDSLRSGVLLREMPGIVALSLASIILIFLGRQLMRRVAEALFSRIRRDAARVLSFVVSLAGVGLQIVGLICLATAVRISGAVGLRGEFIIDALPLWGGMLLAFAWLAERVYPKGDRSALLPMSRERHVAARSNFWLAALVLVLFDIVQTVEQVDRLSPQAEANIIFPIILFGSVLLLRMRQMTNRYRRERAKEGDEIERQGLLRFTAGLGVLGLVVGLAAPVVAALGYTALAEAMVFPAIGTIMLFSLILVLQAFFSDVYGWVTGTGEGAADSLMTALAGFGLAVLALPVLALIWGARPSDLTEAWTRMLDGFSIGETQVSATDILAFVVVFAIGYGLTRALQGTLSNSLLPRTRLDPGGQKAIVSGIGYVGIFVAALAAISSAGIDLSSIALVAGALSVGIGFGLQTIVQNFVSGIILLVERPISEGDWIEVNGQMGYVRNISVRSTRIETFDRSDVIVPNADFISGTVTNYTRGDTVGRVIVPVGVAYGTDTRRVEAILREIAEAHPMVLAAPPPSIVFQGFGADALDFEIRAILRDVNWMLSVKSEMNHQIAQRFIEEGIEIPFAQRDIWLRNPEALRPAVAPAPAEVRSDPMTSGMTDADMPADRTGEANET